MNVETSLRAIRVDGGICGKRLMENQFAWCCFTCGIGNNAIICNDCFHLSDHIGHNTKKLRVIGGNCDCGDPEVWNPKGACLRHAKGYNDETNVTVDLLPESIRETAELKVTSLITQLNQDCLWLEELSNNRKEDVSRQRLKEEIMVIIQALGHLAREVSPIFLHLIAARFCTYGLNLQTKHGCHERVFDSDVESTSFNLLCKKKGINSEDCRIGGFDHPCTCTCMENLMRTLHRFNISFVKDMTGNLFNALLNNRRARFYMGIAYFANYSYILPYCAGITEPLSTLAIQFITYEDVVEKVFTCDYYLSKFDNELGRIFKNLKDYLKTKKSAIRFELSVIHNDIAVIIKERHSKILLPFCLSFIRKIGIFQRFENVLRESNEQSLLLVIADIERIMENIFLNLLSVQDFKDVNQCKEIAKEFKIAVLESVPLEIDSKIFVECLYRCLSLFLVNYLLFHYWDNSSTMDVKKAISELFELTSDPQLFINSILKRVLKFIGFLTEVHIGKWIKQGVIPEFFKINSYYELSLLSILLPLSNLPNLLEFVMRSMYYDENIWKSIEEMISHNTINKERLIINTQIIEHSFYTLCSLLSNDIIYLIPIYILRKSRRSKKFADRNEIPTSAYINYSIKRLLVNTYLKRINKAGLTKEEFNEDLPEQVKNVKRIDKCLEDIAEHYMNPLNRVIKFKLNSHALALYDPFLYNVRNGSEKEELKKMMINIKDSSKFDYLFGELSNSSKLLYTPFKSLIQKRIAQSDIMTSMLKMINRFKLITPWMLRCSYKIVLCCLPYHIKEPQLKEAEIRKQLASNIEPLIEDKNILNEYKVKIDPSVDSLVTKAKSIQEPNRKKMKLKVQEEYKNKVIAFKNKNRMLLDNIQSINPNTIMLVCGLCRKSVSPENYSKEPYGKIVFVDKSKAYKYHLEKILKEDLEFVDGVTNGLIINSCGHYLHDKCLMQLLKSPPENVVSKIDADLSPKNFLCPFCKYCGNNLLIPPDITTNIIRHSTMEMKKMEGLVEEMRNISNMPMKLQDNFSLICSYITYQLHLTDITSIASFSIKEEIIYSLLYWLKFSIETNYYDELISIKERITNELNLLSTKLFEMDLVSLYVKLAVGAKLLEGRFSNTKLLEEFNDKAMFIIKLGIVQEIRFKNKTLNSTIKNESLLKDLDLLPLMRKVLVVKHLLFAGEEGEVISKLDWISDINFYLRGLNINKDIVSSLLGENKEEQSKAFIPLPILNKAWINTCLKEPLSRNSLLIYSTYKASKERFCLMELPDSLNNLISLYVDKECGMCRQVSFNKAVCLLCGISICIKKGNVKKDGIGELARHSMECRSGCGMYLTLNNNKVILMDGGQACIYPSLYVSKYEKDILTSEEKETIKLEIAIKEELEELYLSHFVGQKIRVISLRSIGKIKPYSL